MEKIIRGNGFIIIENEKGIQISWLVGPYDHPVFYDISRENAEKAFRSDKDAYDVKVYAETGIWPPNEEEQREDRKQFIRKFPELLIKIPQNQSLFDDYELKLLLSQVDKKQQ